MKILSPLAAALDFLTRLVPARTHDDATVAASVKYFPLVGLVLGALLTLPFYLGVLRAHPWVQAWLITCGSLWATRGLHWDGLADIVDAWGASIDGQRFWRVIKDSRIGAFGAIALALGLGGQVLLLHEALRAEAYAAVAFSFVFGRALCVALAATTRSLGRTSGLGRLTLRGATPWALALACIITLAAALPLRPLHSLVPVIALGLLGLVELRALAARVGGLNGDFLGAAVVLGELSALLGWLLAAETVPYPF